MPLVGPIFVVFGCEMLPVDFGWWVLLAFLADPDTIILFLSLPFLPRQLFKREHSDRDT